MRQRCRRTGLEGKMVKRGRNAEASINAGVVVCDLMRFENPIRTDMARPAGTDTEAAYLAMLRQRTNSSGASSGAILCDV
jgi:hypothetical protein